MEADTLPLSGRVIAFMDIGTNSVRLLLVRINANQSYTVLSDQKETVRLGEGEFIEQYLQPEAMQRAILVCHKFAEMARSYHAEEIVAVATAATREAQNRDDFIRRLKREAQLDVRVVSGKEEARLIFLGVVSGVYLGDQQALFIDIGGGSTEIILGNQREYLHLDSLKLGAIRVTSLFFLPDETTPVTPVRYAVLKQFVRNALLRTAQQLQGRQMDLAFGSSGTAENLGDIAAYHFYNRARQRDDVFSHAQLKEVIQMLCDMPLEERRRVPGINPGRADIILGGAAILDTIMEELHLPDLHITDRGLRDGLLIDYLSRSEQAPLFTGVSVRERSVLQLGRTCNIDEAHARHVAQLALELFDSARQIHLHRFSSKERELLEYAALVHDVGAFLSYNNHQAHSYYLVRNYDLLGFYQNEINLIALAAFFHRKALPSKKKHLEFAELDKRSQKLVRLYAVVLRLAENLDRSHRSSVEHARFCQGKGKSVVLELTSNSDIQLEVWGTQNHLPAFRKIFDRDLTIEVRQAAAD